MLPSRAGDPPKPVLISIDNGSSSKARCTSRTPSSRLKLTVEMDPSFVDAHVAPGHALRWKGDLAGAINELETARHLSHDRHDALAELGCCYALVGERTKANELADQLKAFPKEANASPFELATIYAALGENEEAVRALQSAYDTRSILIVALESDPVFDPIRTEPRVQQLLKSATASR